MNLKLLNTLSFLVLGPPEKVEEPFGAACLLGKGASSVLASSMGLMTTCDISDIDL